MNERIKELSNKCGLAWTLKTEQDVKNLVEFAESIVQECMNLTEGCRDKYLNSAPYKIAKHFGVE